MGFILEHNSLLRLTDPQLSEIKLEKGEGFNLIKEGERIYPLNIPFEFCDKDYRYIGKIMVNKISIEKNKTTLEGKVLKIFNEEEAKIFSDNFITLDEI